MAGLLKHETQTVEPFEPVGWIDRMIEEWPALFPFRRMSTAPWFPEDWIKVEEYRENGHLVVRAELPGLDPAKDVEVTVANGALHIKAERQEENKTEKKGYTRRELRYGAFTRTLPLPEGVSTADVTAKYRNGILEVRLPLPEATAEQVHKIPVNAS